MQGEQPQQHAHLDQAADAILGPLKADLDVRKAKQERVSLQWQRYMAGVSAVVWCFAISVMLRQLGVLEPLHWIGGGILGPLVAVKLHRN